MRLSSAESRPGLLEDWKTADEARVELAGKGIVIIDTENGPVWKRAKDVE